jgi:hypothetical protein
MNRSFTPRACPQSLMRYTAKLMLVRLEPADLQYLPLGAQLCCATALLARLFNGVRVAATRALDTHNVALHSSISHRILTGKWKSVAQGAPHSCAAYPRWRSSATINVSTPCLVEYRRVSVSPWPPCCRGKMQHTAHALSSTSRYEHGSSFVSGVGANNFD